MPIIAYRVPFLGCCMVSIKMPPHFLCPTIKSLGHSTYGVMPRGMATRHTAWATATDSTPQSGATTVRYNPPVSDTHSRFNCPRPWVCLIASITNQPECSSGNNRRAIRWVESTCSRVSCNSGTPILIPCGPWPVAWAIEPPADTHTKTPMRPTHRLYRRAGATHNDATERHSHRPEP